MTEVELQIAFRFVYEMSFRVKVSKKNGNTFDT